MFPIIGSVGGPGGNLEFEGFGFFDLKNRINTMNKKKDKNIGDTIFLVSSSMVSEGKSYLRCQINSELMFVATNNIGRPEGFYKKNS